MTHSHTRPVLAALLIGASALGWAAPAAANNSNVEATLQSFGDLSMFYQALLNSGVINELKENEEYTIFAPTNAAFSQISPQTYPCFYAVQCRPQIAALVRDHIIVGHYDLDRLTKYGWGIQTAGADRIQISEPYLGDYAVDNHKILSKTEAGGTVIYRIDGVIAKPQDLAQFQAVNYVPPAADVTMTKTTTTYIPAVMQNNTYPAGTIIVPNSPDDNMTETTTVTHRYMTSPE